MGEWGIADNAGKCRQCNKAKNVEHVENAGNAGKNVVIFIPKRLGKFSATQWYRGQQKLLSPRTESQV